MAKSPANQPIFTPTDMRALYNDIFVIGKIADPLTFQYGVVLPGGKLQVLRIENFQSFTLWGEANLLADSFGGTLYKSNWEAFLASAETDEIKIKRFLDSINGSGLVLYEMNISNWEDGFKKIEPAPAGSGATLVRKKCT